MESQPATDTANRPSRPHISSPSACATATVRISTLVALRSQISNPSQYAISSKHYLRPQALDVQELSPTTTTQGSRLSSRATNVHSIRHLNCQDPPPIRNQIHTTPYQRQSSLHNILRRLAPPLRRRLQLRPTFKGAYCRPSGYMFPGSR